MENIYAKMVELFEKNRFSVLATIIKHTGSSPRGIGTKFLIMEDGSFVGTIGGGILEARVLEEAKKVFTTHSPMRLSFFFEGTDVAETDMLCGGHVEVFLEPVSPRNLNHIHIFKKVMEIHRRGSGILFTVVNDKLWQAGQTPKMFLESGGERIGTLFGIQEIEDALMGKMDRILNKRDPQKITCSDHEGNELEIFVEPVMADPILYIFGGGHVSSQIAPLAGRIGFKVVVIDDREEFADPVNFPEAIAVHQYPFDGLLERLLIDESSYLVIVTRGHIHDKTVLAQSLKTRAKYIGMIGSQRKRNIIYEKLLEEGFTQDDLDRVYSPIGIDIGAEKPEEIAVSIAAELIKVRAGHPTL
ncbi:MAG: XdhC family protein [Deltaproteobacteria bacterium]|nr:XdhC family protein [Deltaproteobacteria bacterium]